MFRIHDMSFDPYQSKSKTFQRKNPHLFRYNSDPLPAFDALKSKPAKRIRQSQKAVLNKLEQEFFDRMLSPTTCPCFAQSLRFKLGNGIWYKPDFVTFSVFGTVITAYEVKGPHAFRGGFENLKVAASLYKNIEWKLVWKENGEWKEQVVFP